MVLFFVSVGIIIAMMIADSIFDRLSTQLLRKYGRVGSSSSIASLFTILEMRNLKNDTRLTEEDSRRAKFYYYFMTWGWVCAVVMIIVEFIIVC